GLRSGWSQGAFDVAIRNRNPMELFDLQRRGELHFTFGLVYDFVLAAEDGEENAAKFLAAQLVLPIGIEASASATSTGIVDATGASNLLAATSLTALETPRARRGL